MIIKDLNKCKEIIAGDNTTLKELLNPLKEKISIRYSLAHAKVKPGETTYAHKLKSSEVYYILEGEGEIHIDNETEKVSEGQAIYIPQNSIQRIKNTGVNDLVFLSIVDPAWKPEDEEVTK
ncbi:cupin domain-containing protein [candidate division WOR-3 bacterium]|nr:cupin domain-containing protein [candidate division WOR-3 bacterium]